MLVEGLDLVLTIDGAITIGEVRLFIHGETKPCRLMDEQFPGLRAALTANCRGSVFGQMLTDGMIEMGNTVAIADDWPAFLTGWMGKGCPLCDKSLCENEFIVHKGAA